MRDGIITAGGLCHDMIFEEEPHRYFVKGEEYPGTTKVLGDVGMIDASWFTEEHRHFGSMRHFVTELDDVGDLHEPSVDPRLLPTLHGWRAWRERTGFVPTHVEVWVYSDFGYATIIDRVGYFADRPDETVVLNLKGPAAIASYGPQVSAEQRAFEERTGITVAKRMSVHISRDGDVKEKEHTDHNDLPIFLSALAVFRWKQRNIKERIR